MENNKRLRLFSRMYFIQWLFLTALFSLVMMNGYAQGKAVTGRSLIRLVNQLSALVY